MNIYGQLGKAREQFHELKLKKTGKNKFAGYEYFELGDFLIPAMKCLNDNGLVAVISFGSELATMRIASTKDDSSITITSPMSEANMKGNQPVQNLGAVETYQRRYLWVAAMEIVEHDALDSAEPQKPAAKKPTARLATQDQKNHLQNLKDEQIPPRRLAWLQTGNNFDTMTSKQAEVIIKECEEFVK